MNSAPYIRSTNLISKLDGVKDTTIKVDGIDAIVEFSYHSQKRGADSAVLENAIVFMIQVAFHSIIDLKSGTRFLLTDKELGISIVGGVHVDRFDIVISVASAGDSAFHNPHHTLEIAL